MRISLTFLQDSVRDTTVVDSATNEAVYTVSTIGLVRGTTTLRSAQGEIVGEFERHWGADYVTVHGVRMKLDEWMPSKSFWS